MRLGTITLAIDSRFENVFLVGLAVNRICTAIPMSEQAAYEAEVSVVEAVNNAIRHAYDSEPGHTVEVVVTVGPGAVTFEVCDTGRSLERLEVKLPPVDDQKPENIPEGGRGLYIMHAYSDQVRYQRREGRNVLTLVKLLPDTVRPPEAPGPGPVAQRASAATAAASSSNMEKTR